MNSRRRVEVIAACDDARFVGTIRGKRHEFVDRFSGGLMAFPHADDGFSVRRHTAVGVTQTGWNFRLRSDGPGQREAVLSVEYLIDEVAEENAVAMREIGAAAVLMSTSPGIESRR